MVPPFSVEPGLGELLSAGVLSQAEFEQEKARILNG